MVWPLLRGQLLKGDAEFLLVGFGPRLDGDLDDRVGEVHLLEDDRRLVRVAEGIAGARVFEARQGDDVASVGFLYVLAVVRMHQEHSSDPLAAVARGIEQGHAALESTRIDSAEGERAHERIVHDLERQDRERLVVRGQSDHWLSGPEVDSGRRRNVHRRGKVFDHGVEERLNPLVLEGRTAQHRIEGAGQHRLAQALVENLSRRLLAVQVGFHCLVVEFHRVLDHEVARLVGGRAVIGRDFFVMVVGAQALAVPDDGLHPHEIDDSLEGGLRADGQLNWDRLDAQSVADGLDALLEVRADLVHLVDEHDPRNVVTIGLAPDRFGLGLDPLVAVEHGDAAVQNPQRPLHLDREIDVAGGIDDV